MASSAEINLLVDCFICGRRREQYNPRQLACKHAFCLNCLIDKTVLLTEEYVQCPVCWQKTGLPERGIKGLSSDNRVATVENALKALKMVNVCTICLQSGKLTEASSRCNNCEFRLCLECTKSHTESAQYSGHLVLEKVCKIHFREFSNVCLTCSTGLCYECMVSTFHEGHDICEMTDMMEKVSVIITQGQRLLQDELHRLQASVTRASDHALQVLAKRRLDIKQKIEHCKDDINDKLEKSLNKRKEEFQKLVTKSLEIHVEACAQATNCINEISVVDENKFGVLDKLSRKRHDIFTAFDALGMAAKIEVHCPTITSDVCNIRESTDKRLYTFTCSLGDIQPGSFEKFAKKPKQILRTEKFLYKDTPVDRFWYVVALPSGSAIMAGPGSNYVSQVNKKGKVTADYYTVDGAIMQGVDICNGDIYIGEYKGKTVTVVTREETYSIPITNTKQIFDLAVGEEELFIVDLFRSLQLYSLQGKFIRTVATGKFRYLTAEKQSVNGVVYLVSDEENQRLHIYNANGELVGKIGGKGKKHGQFTDIKGACMLPNGHILVADAELDRVSEFTFHGEFVRHLLTRANGIETPFSVSFNNDCLWVACRELLLIFEYI